MKMVLKISLFRWMKVIRDKIKGDLVGFLKNIDGLDKEIYINYVNGIEGYRVEPLIFMNQKANISQYLVTI